MSGRQRLLTILLVCSLAVNLLLVGGIAGRMLFGGPPPRPMPEQIGWIARQLDDDRRQEVRQELMTHFRNTRPLRREVGSAQREFEAAVSAVEFDPQRAAQALERLRNSQQAWQASSHEQMVQLLARLTPEERTRVTRFLSRHHSPRDGRNGKHRMPDGPREGHPDP